MIMISQQEPSLKRLKIVWPSFGGVASAASHGIGARNAIENYQALEMLRVPLVTVLAREVRLKFFEVDQALEMLRVPLVTIFAREMWLRILWGRPNFGDVASAASHDIGARNAIENDQALEMLWVSLVTVLAREMRLKIVWSWPSFGDVASPISHDIREVPPDVIFGLYEFSRLARPLQHQRTLTNWGDANSQ